MGEKRKEVILRKIEEAGWDARINLFRIEVFEEPELQVVAAVDTEDLYEKMKEILLEVTDEPEIHLRVMGAEFPADYQYAMVVGSVCDMRKEAKFRSERVHQLVFGEWVKILECLNPYYLVKDIKTGYIGHIHGKSLDFCSWEERVEIKSLPKFLVRERFAYLSGMESGYYGEKDIGWIPMGSHLYISKETEQGLYVVTPGGEFWIQKHYCFLAEERSLTEIDQWVEKYLRVPYLWGGCSTYGTDCSGFVGRIYDLSGYYLPRDADQQKAFVKPVTIDEIEKGDLVFFPGHVALYMGKGFIAHSNVTLGGVTFSQILEPTNQYEHYLVRNITGFGRVPKGNR